ncbi:MAG: autotransporter-associated beta strand repeat-containing protein [Opitutales bacterium]
MRLSRSFLLLAAGLSATASATNITVDADLTVNTLAELNGNSFAIGNNAILVIDLRNTLGAPIDGTFTGAFRDGSFDAGGALLVGLDRTGTLVKAGGGTLQYDGFSNLAYLNNSSFDAALGNPIPTDLRPLAGNALVDNGAGQAFAGVIIVEQGQLQVSGYINQWAEYGPYNAGFGVGTTMLGAAATYVEGGAKLSFRNTRLNIVGAAAALGDTAHNNPSTPLVGRLNYLNNVIGVTTSRVETGPDDNYILVLHSDLAAAGIVGVTETTLGILEGKGRVYKTGADALRITNASTFTGEFVSAGGELILAAGSGDTLWSAQSVNLASGGQGSNIAFNSDIHWKPGYTPAGQQTTMVVVGDQRIRNFQSLYGDTGFTSVVNPGTGAGNLVEVANAGDILTIQQETGYDGYFTGSFVGAVDALTGERGAALGTVRKTGAGSLALFSVGNNMSLLEIEAGRLISNVQSLGAGEVVIGNSGELSIVQNDAGALRAVIRTATNDTLATLSFKPADVIYYRGSTTATNLGNADAGVADIVVAQPFFYGRVSVEDGNAIVFSAGNNDAFVNASAILLNAGASGRETSIRFNDTNQLVNNLSGDATSRIYLGRGNITLGVSVASTYSGGIEGVGNLAKQGAQTFTLAGENTYFGATIVRQGRLNVSAANGARNTSGLILTAADTIFGGTGAQSVGSLFGRAGTTVNISGNLTVGVSDELRGRLNTELLSLPVTVDPISPAYYLATETTDSVVGFSPVTTLTLLVQQYNLNDTVTVDGVTDAVEALAYLDTVTVDGDVDEAEVQVHRALLGFAGTLNLGNGGLTKVGAERLILSGTANYKGLTDVQAGILEVGIDTLVGTSGVQVGADGTFAIDVATTRAYTVPLSGSGTFQKIGAGRLDLDSTASAFNGTYDVVGGTLAVTFSPTVTGGTVTNQGDVSLAAGTTFIAKVASNLDWSGEVYGTGTFIKTGAGVLTLTTGTIFHDGLTDVQQGGLVVQAMTAGDLNLAAGTTFVDNVADNPLTALDDTFDGNITGTGQFTKTGLGDLRVENAQSFAGTLIVDAGSLTLVAANAFGSAAQIQLRDGATLVLADGSAQSLGNITSTAGGTISVDTPGTDLTINAPAGPTTTFLGRILGSPDLIKTGAGKLYLDRPSATPNVLSTVTIQAGELEASQAGLGGASVDIAAGATLRFFADTGATDSYAITITGTGSIAKSGAGSVDLSASTLTAASTSIDVAAGTLIVSESALGAGRAPVVTLANGATFEYRATNDASFGVTNFSGSGGVTFGRTATDTPTITLAPNGSGGTGYTGLTTVRDGVTLLLGNGFTSLGGIAAEAGSSLDLSSITSLTITQPVDATFAGTLVGTANLTLKGSSTLTYTANSGSLTGYLGTITVDGGTLALDLSNTKSIALANGGTLSLRGGASNYTGGITGSGNVILEDGVDINLLVGGNAATTTLGSSAVNRITLQGGSILTASFTTGSVLAGKSIQLDGGLLVANGSGAITLNLATPAATPGAANGDSGLELTGTANYTVSGRVIGDLSVDTAVTATFLGSASTADVTGDVIVDGTLTLGQAGTPITVGGSITVDAAATLTGAWTLAGTLSNAGLLAPGFSPAHVTQTALDNSGTLQMELSATTEDQIAFTDTAILNRNGTGRLELVRYGAGDSYGVRHVILKDTVSPGAGSYVSAAAEDPRFATVASLGTSTTSLRYLLVYPTQLQGGVDGILGNADDATDPLRSLAVAGEVAVYQVRSRAEYTCPDAPANVLSWVQDITEVVSTETAPGSGIWVSTLGAGFTSLGARLATLAEDPLCAALDNLAPLGQGALATIALAGVRADQVAIARRLEQRRFDMAGTSVKTSEWFVDALGGRTTVDAGPSASIAGASAGLLSDIGFDGYIGFNLGVDKSKGSQGSASVDTTGIRIGGFGGFMTDDRTLAFDAGLSYSSLSGDLNHPSVFGTNNGGSPDASSLAGWLRVSGAVALDGTWSMTPFAQLAASSTKLSNLSESGQDDALTVEDAKLTESNLSVGLGIQSSWTDGRGGWRYRLSLDLAYTAQLSGDTLKLTSGIPDEGLALYSAERRVLPGSGISIAPSFSFGPDPDSTCTLGIRFDQASEGNATSWEIGYRKRF